jgi:hypothetical protein
MLHQKGYHRSHESLQAGDEWIIQYSWIYCDLKRFTDIDTRCVLWPSQQLWVTKFNRNQHMGASCRGDGSDGGCFIDQERKVLDKVYEIYHEPARNSQVNNGWVRFRNCEIGLVH